MARLISSGTGSPPFNWPASSLSFFLLFSVSAIARSMESARARGSRKLVGIGRKTQVPFTHESHKRVADIVRIVCGNSQRINVTRGRPEQLAFEVLKDDPNGIFAAPNLGDPTTGATA